MSCTENESGPFVVFFLPAVVGCLTILLARRWANSQVSNTSSTAVSRRRKIIKDPLIKRPLPPIACKMVPPGSKKVSGVAKKGFSIPEEEMNGGGKRANRTARLSPTSTPGVGMTDVKLAEGPSPPKHIPFPFIPQDGELLFEGMTFVFVLVATGLQFLNLYRTAWWMPNSYTNQAMSFYLIDPHLVGFIVTITLRRFLLSLTLALLRHVVAPKLMPHATVAARMFILGVVLGAMAWCLYFLILKHTPIKIFYLCYPAVIYVVLFGLQACPFLELTSEDAPLHGCSQDPEQIHAEVEALRQDFNARLKRILFNSIADAYYSSFIPCCFAQSFIYYDVYASSQQVAFVWGGLCGRYAQHLLSGAHCDVPHRAALHLQRHLPLPPTCECPGGLSLWPGGRLFSRAPPCCPDAPKMAQHSRFHAVFINPSVLLCVLLCLQLSLIALQICLLFSSIAWHNFLAIVILLFINYYTLFKMVRDYLVAWKVYKAEHLIQEKNGSIPVSN